jgi:hypothetical protein
MIASRCRSCYSLITIRFPVRHGSSGLRSGRFRRGGSRGTYELPRKFRQVRYIQSPDVVQGPHSVTSAEYIDTVLIQACCMCSSLRRSNAANFRFSISKANGIKYVNVIVVSRPVPPAEDNQLLPDRCCRHGPQRWWHIACTFWF